MLFTDHAHARLPPSGPAAVDVPMYFFAASAIFALIDPAGGGGCAVAIAWAACDCSAAEFGAGPWFAYVDCDGSMPERCARLWPLHADGGCFALSSAITLSSSANRSSTSPMPSLPA